MPHMWSFFNALNKSHIKKCAKYKLTPATKFVCSENIDFYLPNASAPMTSRFLDILLHRAFTASLSFLLKLMSVLFVNLEGKF